MNKLANTLNPRDLNLIRNFLLGGAALGGAAGLGTSFANYLRTLRQEQPKASDDDDVLYLKMPPNKVAAEKSAVLGGGLALAGGTLAAVGSYALARKLYQSMKRKRIQEELDRAQSGYMDAVGAEAKTASQGKPMGMTEFLTSAPVALPILLGVGSGVLANRALSQAFPSKRKRLKLGPRKVVILRPGETPPHPEDEEQDPILKPASYDPDDGMEFLVNTVLGMSKEANDLSDLIGALASGRSQEMRQLTTDYDTNVMLDMIKGASAAPVPETSRAMAVSYAVKSAEFGPITRLLAAAEFAHACPVFFKVATHVDEQSAEALTGMLSFLGAAVRRETFIPHVKAAAMVDATAPQGINPQILELLMTLQKSQMGQGLGQMAKGLMGEQGQSRAGGSHDEQLTDQYDSETSVNQPGDKRDNDSDDFIDQILSGNEAEQEVSDDGGKKEDDDKHPHVGNRLSYSTPEA